MELTIVIENKDETDILTEIALTNNVSTSTYVTNMLRTFLQGQVKGRYMEALGSLNAAKMQTVLGKTYAEIKAAAVEANKEGG